MKVYCHQRMSHEVFFFVFSLALTFLKFHYSNDYVLYYGISGLNLLNWWIWLVELENEARLFSRFVIHTLGGWCKSKCF